MASTEFLVSVIDRGREGAVKPVKDVNRDGNGCAVVW
jgi:hypothetical protein